MSQQIIDISTLPDSRRGDPWYTAFGKCNDNFTELYGVFTGVNPPNPLNLYALTAMNFIVDGQTLVSINAGTADADRWVFNRAILIYHGSGQSSSKEVSKNRGPAGGGGWKAATDDGTPMQTGDQMGFYLFSGVYDGTHTLYNSAGFLCYPTENWDATHHGADVVVALTDNATITRREVGRWKANGDFQLTLGRLLFATAASKVVPGATSLSFRNHADSADNLILVDAGDATFRTSIVAGTTIAAGTTIVAGTTIAAGTTVTAGTDFLGQRVVLSGRTFTTDAKLADLAATWNNGTVTFTAIKLNITSTASAVGSLLFDLQVGGASKFSVDKSGNVIAAGSVTGVGKGPKILFLDTSSTVSGVEASITSYTMPGGTLSADKQALRITVVGYADGTVSFAIKFGATYVTPRLQYTGSKFRVDVIVTRAGAALQSATSVGIDAGGFVERDHTSPTETLSGNVVIDFRGDTNGGTATFCAVQSALVELIDLP